jgi:hypothetical protein
MIKACYFALFVTHLWDIPDEPGHFSYVADLADGHYPILGKAKMTPEVMQSWKGWPATNWIAQHPPLYYALDVPVLWTARAAGLSAEQQFHVVRLPSALFGALAIFAAGLIGFRVTRSSMGAVAASLLLAGTPMLLHMSSGTSHDTLVAMLCMFSAYFLLTFLQRARTPALYASGVFAGLASVTKITALAMAVPVFLVVAFYLFLRRENIASWLRRSIVVWLAFFTLPVIMMIVNYLIYGHMFPSGASITGAGAALVPIGYFEYVLNYPIFQNVIINYFGLIGWTGVGQGHVQLLQVRGGYLTYFLFGLIVGFMVLIGERTLVALGRSRERGMQTLTVGIAVMLTAVILHRPAPPMQLSIAAALVFAASVWVLLVPLLRRLRRVGEELDWIYVVSAVAILFFSVAYYTQLQTTFIGEMRAVHGRYFYPILPFFFAIIMRSLSRLRAEWAAFLFGLGSLIVSDWFFLHKAFPFYGIL